MLVAVIFILTILILSMAIAAPKVAREIQRDRDIETVHRGKQYIRGIKLYYKKFGKYPPNPDALYKPTNDIRFLRKKYADPTTGKDEWKPVLFGQNKTVPLGLFGQPIGTPPADPCAGGGGAAGGSSGFGSLNIATSANCPAGSTSTDSNNSSSGANPTPTPNPNIPPNPNLPGTPTAYGTGGQTIGGGGIIGFSPNSPKESIVVWRKKKKYNEWEFTYDPLAEQMMGGASGGNLGANGLQNGNNPNGGPSSNPGFGSTPTAPTSAPVPAPTSPPQQ